MNYLQKLLVHRQTRRPWAWAALAALILVIAYGSPQLMGAVPAPAGAANGAKAVAGEHAAVAAQAGHEAAQDGEHIAGHEAVGGHMRPDAQLCGVGGAGPPRSS